MHKIGLINLLVIRIFSQQIFDICLLSTITITLFIFYSILAGIGEISNSRYSNDLKAYACK